MDLLSIRIFDALLVQIVSGSQPPKNRFTAT